MPKRQVTSHWSHKEKHRERRHHLEPHISWRPWQHVTNKVLSERAPIGDYRPVHLLPRGALRGPHKGCVKPAPLSQHYARAGLTPHQRGSHQQVHFDNAEPHTVADKLCTQMASRITLHHGVGTERPARHSKKSGCIETNWTPHMYYGRLLWQDPVIATDDE